MAKILSTRVLCKQPGRYIGWPTIGLHPNGELLVVFSGDRDAHVDPFGKSMLIRSADLGTTWGEPELINDTPFDDRDTGLCILPDGTVIMSWFTSHFTTEFYLARARQYHPSEVDRWKAHLDTITEEDILRWLGPEVNDEGRYQLGHFIRRSHDAGRTWEDPIRVPPTTPHGPIPLSDGRVGYLGTEDFNGRRERRFDLIFSTSDDKGMTWETIARIPRFPPYHGSDPKGTAYIVEPHVVEVSPGHLLGMARHEELPRRHTREVGRLWQFDSYDGGRTWTIPTVTEMVGKPPHLIRLRDGRLLCTYGLRLEPFGERATISRDGGKTWDTEHEHVLVDDAPTGDLGYPATVELPDGSLFTVYYEEHVKGEKTCLMGTHWLPDD